MNYVVPSDMPFKVKNDLKRRKEPSAQSKAVKKFADTHNIYTTLDPETGKLIIKVTEISNEE